MTKLIKRALCGAVFAVICSVARADTVPLAITPPFPDLSPPPRELPVLQVVQPVTPSLQRRAAGAPIDAITVQANISAFGFACDTKLNVNATAGAMMRVTLSGPCRPNQLVRITHAGLAFDAALSLTGEATFALPALASPAKITARFPDGHTLTAVAKVDGLDEFLRIGLQSNAAAGLRLKPSSPKALPVNSFELGDGVGEMMQVLSHHRDPERRNGVIRLALMAEVLADHCDQNSHANVVERLPGLPLRQYGLSLSAPGCARVGEILELKNILQDLKLAAH